MKGKRKSRDHEDYFEIDEHGEPREKLSFQFTHPDTLQTVSVSINPEMTSESFRKAIKDAGYPGGQYPCEFFCDDEDRSWIERILGDDAKKLNWEDRRQRQDKESIEVEAEMTITPRHHRGVAKIAFNHLMYFSPMGLKGDEETFTKLRLFIRHGTGKPREFVRYVQGDILAGLNHGVALANYGHLVTCEVGPKVVTAKVQLCTGREMGHGYYEVLLGPYPFAIDRGIERVGHYFRVTSVPTDSKDQGEVIKLFSPTHINPVQLRPRSVKLLIPRR